jgi:hypothetical protein
MLVSNGSLAADRKTAYWNDSHDFRTQNGVSLAPITASSIQVTAITTGGNTTAGTISGRWTLTGTSPNVSGFTLTTVAGDALTTTAGTLTGLTYVTETVIDISGTGNNAQYFEKVASTAATATAAKGSGATDGANSLMSKVTHAGWVRRIVGTGGRAGRIQYETLVANGTTAATSGDQADDIQFGDS